MSSSETGRLVVTGTQVGTWLEVYDGAFRVVGENWDYVNIDVPEGVYQLQATLAGNQTTRLISVRPGHAVEQELSVPFSAAAPVEGLVSSRPIHSDFAAWLSKYVADTEGAAAGLVLILRNFDDGPKLQADRVELLDNQLKPVPQWPQPWFLADADIVGKSARLRPGPYVLRTRVKQAGDDDAVIDQTVWLANEWQTLIFLPNSERGPDARGMSVQMTPLSEPWDPTAESSLELEAAVGGLRAGASDVSPRMIRSAFRQVATNPMLAIATLQMWPRKSVTEDREFKSLITRLLEALGNHPDVLSLAAADRRTDATPVPWPPMFDRSYRKFLLAADVEEKDLIPEDSPAELIAPFLRIPGPLLQWESTDQVLSYDARTTPQEAWVNPNWRWHGERRGPVPKEAERQVSEGIDEIASFQKQERADLVASLGVANLAQILSLPKSLVRSAITDLGLPAYGLVHA